MRIFLRFTSGKEISLTNAELREFLDKTDPQPGAMKTVDWPQKKTIPTTGGPSDWPPPPPVTS